MAGEENLDDYVRQWAMECFHFTKSKEQGKVAKENLEIDINWKRVKIQHDDPEFEEKTKIPTPKLQTLFRTSFSNSTKEVQQYTFRTERTTASICEVAIDNTYTIGAEMNLGFKCPMEVFEANAGFKREFSITKSRGQVAEEYLTWGVDSSIIVPPNSKTIATLEIFQDEMAAKFKLVSVFSGIVIATITNLKDNNSIIMGIEGNIAEILRDVKQKGHLKNCTIDKEKARIVTEGKCNFKYAIEQKINILPDK